MILLSQSYTPALRIPLAMLAVGIAAVIYSMGPPLLSEITPVQQQGAILGLSNAAFSLAGLIAPWLTGHIVDVGLDPAAGFRQGFLFGGCLICVGGLVAAVLIKPASDLARFVNGEVARDDPTTKVSGQSWSVLESRDFARRAQRRGIGALQRCSVALVSVRTDSGIVPNINHTSSTHPDLRVRARARAREAAPGRHAEAG
jgi:MFS family permease